MSKKLIIMTAVAGLVSFAGAFVFGWFTTPAPAGRSDELTKSTHTIEETGLNLSPEQLVTTVPADPGQSAMKKTMTEKQLKNLVYEVREKIQEYNNKLQGLEARELRLRIAQDVLKKDIENLNNLRTELASIVASLKEQRDNLLESRVEIAKAEKTSLMSLAAAYDKMDSSSSSKIITNMCKSQLQKSGFGGPDSSFDDAVKILHYMTERTKAKLLGELVTSEPKLTAVLCQRLKQIVEEK